MSDETAPDLSQIQDADLRRKLVVARERFKLPAVFDVEVRQLIAEQQARNAGKASRTAELDAMPRETRRRALTLDHFLEEAPTASDIRHLHSVLAICGLPYERLPIEQRDFRRVQGNMGIMVQAGSTLMPNGQWVDQPIPFGPKARLILMHLCSEAIRQKSPTIEIADTFTAFVREMGFSDSGGKKGPLTAFREQLNALATCSIRISSTDPTKPKVKQFFPIEEMEVWLSADARQKSLWPSTVTFSPFMYESLLKHALPVNGRVVRAFQGSARKLDIYFWLGWRMYNINAPLVISWDAIAEQFGSGFSRQRAFKAKFNEEIDHIREVLPKLPLKLTESGLILEPADPSVLALPPKRTLLKKA
uniref:Replication protein A n=1 Tax=Sinorhizobium fredii (strain HH103) TaxID=1117943 RepID=A0A0A8WJF1_SINF1|nr:replication protein RepA [Sinorhizobium fredii]CEL26556.1 replication protein A [Sinorhizobium fredii HH103]